MSKIKTVLVEDDPMWLELMTNFLNKQTDIVVVGTACTKEDAILVAKSEFEIDIILMDINLSENKCDGISTALEIYKMRQIKIIMLTSLDANELITNAFAAGAINYISKSNYKNIPDTIRNTFEQKSPLEVLLELHILRMTAKCTIQSFIILMQLFP